MSKGPNKWPVAAPGFYLGYLAGGRVLLTLMGKQCSAESFTAYIDEMQAGIDCMSAGDEIISIHAIAAPEFWTKATLAERARRMKAIADLGEKNKAALKAAFKYEVQVPTHSLARIALRVLTSLVSMPYPSDIQPTLNDALLHLEKHKVGTAAEVRAWREEIAVLVRKYAEDFDTAALRAAA